jgi:class 3 adenylate cyclase
MKKSRIWFISDNPCFCFARLTGISFLLVGLPLLPLFASSEGQLRIDSLKRALITERSDTQKVNILNALSKQCWQISDYENSAKYVEQAIAESDHAGFRKGLADAYMNKGVLYWFEGNFPEALKWYNEAITIQKETGDKRGLANALNNIGAVYFEQGNYAEALKQQFAGLKIREEIGDQYGIAASHNNIGNNYYSLRKYDKAKEHYESALLLRRKINDKAGVAAMYGNIGLLYSEQGMHQKALEQYQLSLKMNEEIGDKNAIAHSTNIIGTSYLDVGDPEQALTYFSKAFDLFSQIGNQSGVADVSRHIGHSKLLLKNEKEGREWIMKGLGLDMELGQLDGLKTDYQLLALADSMKGDYKSAYANYKTYILYRDSLNNEEIERKSIQENLQYEYDKKEAASTARHEAALSEQKLIRNSLMGGFAAVLLFSIVIYRQRNKTRREKQRAEAETARAEKERERSEELLLNILPQEVAQELKAHGRARAKAYTMVTVMFTDFKDFTAISEKVSAEILVDEIHYCFSAFDTILQKYNIEKIKTIGDAYLCASGLPASNISHAQDIVRAAIEIRDFMQRRKSEAPFGSLGAFELRIGIHTGPVVAGIVGIKKYAYDIWGDTVNMAARMEQHSEAGMINISGTTYELVKQIFNCRHRGKVPAKNKGEMDMYFVESVL